MGLGFELTANNLVVTKSNPTALIDRVLLIITLMQGYQKIANSKKEKEQ